MNEMKTYIASLQELLPVGTSISYTEAERRAGTFLHAQATLTDWRHTLSSEKIRLLSIQTAVYATKMSEGTAKTVTENKLSAEASAEYTKAREDLEHIENDLNYLKAYFDIFTAAHVFYRQMARGDNG